jgi:hypothetical protein
LFPATPPQVVVAVVPAELVVQLAVEASSQVPEAVVPALAPPVTPLVSQYTVVWARSAPHVAAIANAQIIQDLNVGKTPRWVAEIMAKSADKILFHRRRSVNLESGGYPLTILGQSGPEETAYSSGDA